VRRRVVLATAGLVLTLLAGAAGAASRSERARELEEVRAAIQETRGRVEAFERQERSLLETLEEMDRAAARLRKAAAETRERARTAREELARLEGRAAALEERRQRTRRAMAARAVALYKTGEAGPVAALFSARSLRELLLHSRVLRRLLEHDRELLSRFAADGRALEQTRSRAAAAEAEAEHALALARERGRALTAERRARRELVTAVRADRRVERETLQELEAAAVALEEALARLEEGPAGQGDGAFAGTGFAARRGALPPPVEAPVVRGFGRVVDAEFRTETFRKGVDFAAAAGAPVRAVASGRVRFAGWFRGYGRMVILDHGDGYFTVSGHLDELTVETGESVEQGQSLGTVGETGSLTGPRLYFEIRRGARPLDPAAWLSARGEEAGGAAAAR